ncbi:MAG: hypothetical protein ACI30V_07080 [Muribaculaceae bacterium]
MKHLTKTVRTLIATALLTVFCTTFSGCSDEKYGIYLYTFNIERTEQPVDQESKAILDAYRQAIGFTGFEASLSGDEDTCNQKVLDGCAQAQAKVEQMQLSGGYVMRVVNNATYKTIYSHGFGLLEGEDGIIDK